MELSPTAHVILGLLSLGPKSGYEIKAFVDRSVRFFWAASYGQIYPELRRLADAGLIEGEAKPAGGRRRTVYELTAEGRRRLREWLAVDPAVFEMRDEGLLKLFFADATGGSSAIETLAAKRRHHLEIVEVLRAIEPLAASRRERFPLVVCRYGIECNQWMADWCLRMAEELSASEEAEPTRRTA
jgi:PadR family transcriptional regulator, regulatory protein AphA